MTHKTDRRRPRAARRHARPGRGRGRDARRRPRRQVTDVQLRIYEPPRFFEAFLRGRALTEPPDITARICGICPVAYQMSACLAIEDACGVEVTERDPAAAPAALLRRVDREPRAARLPAARAGLPRLRRRHRDGGRPPRRRRAGAAAEEGRQRRHGRRRRPVDPPGQRAGRRVLPAARPAPSCAPSGPTLERARDDALATVAAGRRLRLPRLRAAVRVRRAARRRTATRSSPARVVTTAGGCLRRADFADARHRGARRALQRAARPPRRPAAPYVVGPLARYSLNHDRLSPLAREAAARGRARRRRAATRSGPSWCARSSSSYAFDEALRIIDGWTGSAAPTSPCRPRAGDGHGATEAPRGLLFHRYVLDADGTILDAADRPAHVAEPGSIEADLRRSSQDRLDLDDHELHTAVRAGDPQLRPVHLLRHPLPRPDRGAGMSTDARVTGRSDSSSGWATPTAATTGSAPRSRGAVAAGSPAGRPGPGAATTRPTLLDALDRRDLVVIVDAVAPGPRPAPSDLLDVPAQAGPPLPERAWSATGRGGTHALGLAAAVELARALRPAARPA